MSFLTVVNRKRLTVVNRCKLLTVVNRCKLLTVVYKLLSVVNRYRLVTVVNSRQLRGARLIRLQTAARGPLFVAGKT